MAREDSGAARSSVSAALRVDEEQPTATGTMAFGPYVLWASLRRLERNGLPIRLGDRAFDILCALTERAGEIVTNRELMVRVWGNVVVGTGSLRFHVNALRKVFAQDGSAAPYIKNVTRRGYTFIAPVRRVSAEAPVRFARLLSQSGLISLVGPEVAHALLEQLAIRASEEFGGRLPESVTLVAIVLGKLAVK
jgi:DNA-binding winged helix-turn-helix (wHTH) protein